MQNKKAKSFGNTIWIHKSYPYIQKVNVDRSVQNIEQLVSKLNAT